MHGGGPLDQIRSLGNSPEQFSAFMREEVQKWGGVVRRQGIKVD